jgi:hypothetical protein
LFQNWADHKHQRAAKRLLGLFLGCTLCFWAPSGFAQISSQALLETVCCDQLRTHQAMQIFEQIRDPSPQDLYLAGYVLMYTHKMEKAAPLLRRAQQQGFEGIPSWPSTSEFLKRIETFHKFAPPFRPDLSKPLIQVYQNHQETWSRSLTAQLPELLVIGRSIFGNKLPSLRLYLFGKRAHFETLFKAVLGREPFVSWQDGTGYLGFVMYSRESQGGKIKRLPENPETRNILLHELAHAWIITYLDNEYDLNWIGPRHIPLLDEGLAEYIVAVKDPKMMKRRRNWIKTQKVAKGISAPPLDTFFTRQQFYEPKDADLHYWLSALLMQQVLGKDGTVLIPKLLHVWASGANIEQTILLTTGKKLRQEYQQLVQRLWHQK